jgi:hypothetical protein
MDRSKGILKIAAGLAGGTAVAGAASPAGAAIVSGEFQTNGSSQVSDTTSPPNESYPFDLNNDGTNDFIVASAYSKSKPGKPADTTKYYTYKGDSVAATADNAVASMLFNAGDEIGPAAIYNQGGSSDAIYDNGNPSAYFGLRFGAIAPYNYGWVQLREGASPNAWDLVTFGYETTPDTPISAGAAGAVPEPASLATLALGAAAVALRRRGPRA